MVSEETLLHSFYLLITFMYLTECNSGWCTLKINHKKLTIKKHSIRTEVTNDRVAESITMIGKTAIP